MKVRVDLFIEVAVCLTTFGNENRYQVRNKWFCLFFELKGMRVKAWN
ncbi:hypothetical protein SerAS12_3507 [Serratia sp. AS12]|nr:hypothetical protein SerAS9_3506 [Serratia plymuthica AS9]AEF51567.1 hypothetical protein SerAS12_3507 [Serratia sp. AS12]AEG29274.1 hypothetical protein SerAS13_3508 [Serratia sp. AS13]